MKKYLNKSALFVLFGLIATIILIGNATNSWQKISQKLTLIAQNKTVLSLNETIIPVRLNNLGQMMLKEGVIDQGKIESKEGMVRLLKDNGSNIVITKDNASYLLNFFWAFGLSNKNEILEKGPMTQNGKTANFASTGGWSLSRGQAMDHYSKHNFITLTSGQQKMVEEMAKNIYRPCCNNSTYFPDCNHGMAMLGFLELAAAQNLDEEQIYKDALILNTFWFPNDYLTIDQYLKENSQNLVGFNPKIILGKNFSSQQGFAYIRSQVKDLPFVTGGGSCGV
ncbi:MAG: hypothetical protein M1429_03975 [Patescibacteria group bacterium]|nr:hypothetical protein [Patescibacteria group bacterium]